MALADFEHLLRASIGLDAASIGASAIERAVMERAHACELPDLEAYWQRVCASPAELQTLIEAVVVPETWFFRDREAFATLARVVREGALASPGGVFRVLSLPSATGEEPYSIAMALFDAGIVPERFAIDAVDVSARALARAQAATYGRNSFRGRELGFRTRYFDASPAGYRLCDRVRCQVEFRQGNLFGDWSAGGPVYEAIFCRNLLIYFDRETQARAIGVLERRLAPGGMLFVAPSETALPIGHGFVPVKVPFAFAFRRPGAERHGIANRPRVAPSPVPLLPRVPRRAKSHPSCPSAAPAVPRTSTDTQPIGIPLEDAADLANRGRFDDAIEQCEAHMRRSGPSADAFHLMGLVREASGNPAEAERCYRKALYLDPQHREVLMHLALLLERAGESRESQLLRKRANRPHTRSA